MQQIFISLLSKLRFLAAGVYVLICLFMLSLLVSAITGDNAQAASSNTDIIVNTGGPNQVSNGMAMALDGTDNAINTVSGALSSGSKTLASGIGHSGTAVSRAASFVVLGTYHGFAAAVHGIGHGFAVAALGIGHGIGYIGRSIGGGLLYTVHIQESFGSAIVASAAVKPTGKPVEQKPLAVTASAPAKAKTALSAATQPSPATPLSIWPIHGEITTEFGVPEPPFQPIHTGIDISDGEPSGVTPVKAFRAGRVIDIERGGGLGNHVIVDHGGGLTSVYGHLYSIAVAVGQAVDTTTTLGYEGSTGVSTGPHVHFEIRVSGQPVNPHLYVSGTPD